MRCNGTARHTHRLLEQIRDSARLFAAHGDVYGHARSGALTDVVDRSGSDAELQKALRDSSVKLEVGPDEDHYWEDYAKTHPFTQWHEPGAATK